MEKNILINNAKEDYILFIDHDDLLSNDCLNYFYENINHDVIILKRKFWERFLKVGNISKKNNHTSDYFFCHNLSWTNQIMKGCFNEIF